MKKLPDIKGFNECSETGTDTFAPSIFLEGCNLRCPYCMNSILVKHQASNTVNIDRVKAYVLESKSEWVMISGGEPTCTELESLINLIEEIKGWGCKVGMSTNGVNTEVIREILPRLNYVALDIKGSSWVYDEISKDKKASMNNLISRSLLSEIKLKRNDFDYEIRTTLFPPFVDEKTIHDIGSIIRTNDTWVFQPFRHSKNMLDADCSEIKPYSEKEIEALLKIAKQYTEKVFLRYV